MHDKPPNKETSLLVWGKPASWKTELEVIFPDDQVPRAILKTRITRIIVGLIGIMPDFISSRMIPAIDKITIAVSSWFHLEQMKEQKLITTYVQHKMD